MDTSSPKVRTRRRSSVVQEPKSDNEEDQTLCCRVQDDKTYKNGVQRSGRKKSRPRSQDTVGAEVGMKKRKLMRKGPAIKRRRVSGHVIGYEEPLRRSKREKRLVFATLNMSQMDKQILNPGPSYQDLDLSEEEMDPYEKLLSPCRKTRRSARLNQAKREGEVEEKDDDGGLEQDSVPKKKEGKKTKKVTVKEENNSEEEEEGEEEAGGTEEQSEEEEEEEEEEGDGEEEEEEEEEEEGGYYNLRKRQPVIYHFQPVHEVVQRSSPVKRRRKRMTRHSSYHSKGSGPVAYQRGQSSRAGTSSRRREAAHHDSSTTSSDSDSDEGRFRRRKNKSMGKARMQCLPMNFTNDDMAQQGLVRDRVRIGASLADINPMTIDKSITFDSIGGLKDHIRALKEMIIFPFLYPEVFEHFQINPPRGVLFHGPPGCGKTLVARALANECSKGNKKVAFFMRKGADCLSKWVGESERQLRLLFDQAYQFRPSIIFFDEIDGLAPIRSSRQDQIHSSIVSTLLALMDGLDSRGEVVVIGATNRIDAIDPALRRPGRFDREFVFPLPTREDRCSILSIHTRAWHPRLKPEFVSELADGTVGYCGADLRSLCTEAALFALRRRYPQIYNSTERLKLDIAKIRISSVDFQNALRAIVPTAQRSDGSVARSLPGHLRCVYVPVLQSLLSLVSFIFYPAWKSVRNASREVEIWSKGLNSLAHTIELRLEELGRQSLPPASSQWNGEGVRLSNNSVVANHVSSYSEEVGGVSSGQSRLNSRSLDNNYWSKSRSTSGHKLHLKKDSLRSYSLPGQDYQVSRIGPYSETSVVHKKQQEQSQSSQSVHLLQHSENKNDPSFSDLYQKPEFRPSDLGRVFFDMTELSCEGGGADCHAYHYPSSSILEEDRDRRAMSERSSASCSQPADLNRYLGAASHPHIPPTVHSPRLVLCGRAGMGQSMYLAPALLHALEDFPVKTVDLLTVFGSSARSSEETFTQIFREATRVTPSILYLPRVDSWWNVTSETFQVTLLSSLSSLPPSTSLFVLATTECAWEELPDKLRAVFGSTDTHSYMVVPPDLNQRRQLFYDVLLDKPLQPPPHTPRFLSDLPLEELPVASPPKPHVLTKEEWSKLTRQREAVLRELRMFLRDATNKLLAERKFKEFGKPVKPEDVPDYYEIIAYPMDLGTMMKKIDEHCYTLPKQWVADIELIAKNALEYNPEHDPESRLLRHRATALQDMAHSFLDHELSEEFEKQCEEIEETYLKLSGSYEEMQELQLQGHTTMEDRSSFSAHLSSGLGKSELYDAPRRSLRQLGLQPVEPGFPYYSPAKQRGSGKRQKMAGDQSCTSMDSEVTGGRERSVRSCSILSVDETNHSNHSGSSCGKRQQLLQNSTACSNENLDGPRVSNTSVRRQIIRPWEDQLLEKMDKRMSDTGEPDKCPENVSASDHVIGRNGINGGKELGSAMAQSLTSTPAKDVQSSAWAADSSLLKFAEGGLVNGQLEPHLALEGGAGAGMGNQSNLRNCSGLSLQEGVVERGQGSGSPQANQQVVVDVGELLQLYGKVVADTEGYSVEKMEGLHATFEQLVFRHRMQWDKESLLADLRVAARLFFQ